MQAEACILDVEATAVDLLREGFHPVPIRSAAEYAEGNGKAPVGVGWGLERPTADALRSAYARRPDAGVGLCLGPGKAPGGGWLVDLEGDGEGAEDAFLALAGGEVVETMGWTSARGRHRLFVAGPGFLDLLQAAGAVEGRGARSGVYHLAALPGLEFRVGGFKPDGTVKQLQSVCPPSEGTDGEPRRWSGPREVAPVPDAILASLEALGERAAIQGEGRPGPRVTSPRGGDGAALGPYVEKALAGELARVEGAAEGSRNDALNRAAFSVGTLVGAGAVPESEAAGALAASGRAAGLGEAEVRATVRSGMEAGKRSPRDLSGVGARGRAVEASPRFDTRIETADALVEVEVTTDEMEVADRAVEALAGDLEVYRLGFALASVLDSGEATPGVDHRGAPPPQIRRLGLPTLRERIAGRVRFVRVRKGDGERVAVHVPDWLVKAVEARGVYPGVRPIEGIVQAPTMRRDGSILDVPGYDAATRLVYRPNARFGPIPPAPSRADAEAARDELLGLAADFPFRGDADRASWLAAMLTVVARPSFDGPAPLFGFDANVPGAGKSLLCDAIAMVATGRPMPRTVWPCGAHANEEVRKRITSIALAGERMVLIDNADEPIGGASLDAALTATSWKDRILSRSEMTAELPLNTVWFASGNNLQTRGDLIRRVLFARIETPLERPEERTGFRHPDLMGFILRERARLVAAALTILRAYHVAGRPDVEVRPLGSFEDWTRSIARPVAWIMGVNPLDVRAASREVDQAASRRNALVLGWAELPFAETGMTAAQVVRMLNDPENRDRFATLRDALMDLSPTSGLPSARTIGRHLSALNGRTVQGLTIRGVSQHGTILWRVVRP